MKTSPSNLRRPSASFTIPKDSKQRIMLPKNFPTIFSITKPKAGILFALIGSLLLVPATQATTLYWDTNGAVAGAGSTPNGTWSAAGSGGNWTTDSTGSSATTSYTAASDVVFSAGTDAINAYTISLSANQIVNSLTYNNAGTSVWSGSGNRDLTLNGNVTLSSGAGGLTIGSTGANQNIFARLGANQTWTNDSSSTLRFVNAAGGLATGTVPVTLTIAGSGSGTVLFSNSLNNGAAGAVVSLVIASTGSGITTMSGGNYSGGTTIKSGTLSTSGLGNGSVLLGEVSGSSNATLTLNTSNSLTNNITVQAGSSNNTLTLGNTGSGTPTFAGTLKLDKDLTIATSSTLASTLSISGLVSGVGKITTGGTAALLLSNANTYSGGTTVNSGGLRINNGGNSSSESAIGTGTLKIAGGSIDNTSGSAVTLATNNAQTWDGNFTFTGSNNLDLGTGGVSLGTAAGTARTVTTTAGNLTVGGVISNGSTATGLVKAGAGNLILRGANSYDGGTSVNAGTLTLSGSGTLGATTGSLAFGGGTLDLGGSSQTVGAVTITAGPAAGNTIQNGDLTAASFTVSNASGTAAITANLTGSGAALSKSGAGNLTLSGTNTYSGGTSLSAGTLRINNGGTSSANSAIGTGNLTITGGTIDNTSGSSVTLATNNAQAWNTNFTFAGTNNLNLGTGAVTLGGSNQRVVTITAGTLTIGGAISNGSGNGLAKSGNGTLALTSTGSNYTGITSINAGGVLEVTKLANNNVASSIGQNTASGNTVMSGNGTLRYVGSGDSTDRKLTIGGGGGAALDASGTGAINFTNTSTSAFGTGGIAYIFNLTGSNTDANTYAANQTNNGVGAFSIVKSGTGKWVLSGNNTYTGGTTISNGTLNVTGSLADTGAVTVSGGIYTVGANDTVGAVSLTSGTINGSGILTGSAYSVESGAVALNLAGSANLTKSTGGTVTLSGANAFTGSMVINAGTLLVSGSGTVNASSGISVNGGLLDYQNNSTGLDRNVTVNGGTFKNNSTQNYTGVLTFTSGSVGGTNLSGVALTIGANQTISPGNSPGTLTTGAETWTGGGSYVWEINNATGAQGTNWDFISSSGLLDITGLSTSSRFNINIVGLTALNASGAVPNWDGSIGGQSWKIASFTGISGTFATNLFNIDATGFTDNNTAAGTFGISNIGNDLYVTYAIPEPSTWALLAFSLTTVIVLRRRRS